MAKAKPGDRIRVINSILPSYDKEYVVVEPPPEGTPNYSKEDLATGVFVRKGKALTWFYPTSCEIIGKAIPIGVESCPDCKGTGQIELFTSTVKCKRCGDSE